MSSYQAHLHQAQHNEGLLSELMASLSYKDWLVTVAFYSAIHYVEAAFFNNPAIEHTDTSIPTRPDGGWRDSPHIWRMKLLEKHYPKDVWKGFKSLSNASWVARYLVTQPSRRGIPVTTDAQTHWTDNEARDFVDVDLINIKNGLGFS